MFYIIIFEIKYFRFLRAHVFLNNECKNQTSKLKMKLWKKILRSRVKCFHVEVHSLFYKNVLSPDDGIAENALIGKIKNVLILPPAQKLR